MLQIYENIKNRRNELGLSQQDLAELVGYADKSMIAKIEKGYVDLSQTKIEIFANALKTTPSALMGWKEAPRTSESGRKAALLIKDEEVLNRAYKLHLASDETRKIVFKLMDSFLN